MITFKEALEKGFKKQEDNYDRLRDIGADTDPSWSFEWKDGDNTYELAFEKLLWDKQYYVALYKNQSLLTDKVVIKPGYEKNTNK